MEGGMFQPFLVSRQEAKRQLGWTWTWMEKVAQVIPIIEDKDQYGGRRCLGVGPEDADCMGRGEGERIREDRNGTKRLRD